MIRQFSLWTLLSLLLLSSAGWLFRQLWAAPEQGGQYPILFVTQVPNRYDFTTIGSTFGNHEGSVSSAPRGGDLWIWYPDGTLKNLTQEAGYGMEGFQGDEAIAVRDPIVHWDGQKAIFSMVIGGASEQYEYETYYWQLYEVSGLDQEDTPVITKVPNQPVGFNNISPIYTSDDKIIFTSDRPRNGETHLYPQRDEYELAATNSGLWWLDPATAELRLLNHAPSGDFMPIIDSFGRVVVTQWDHLQRDQLADADAGYGSGENCDSGAEYGTFNYSDESANAVRLPDRTEVFPEPRQCRQDLLEGTGLYGNSFNHFFPWTFNQDGTDGEVLAHLGRHELHGYIAYARIDDPNIVEYYGQYARFNPNGIENMFQIEEDPLNAGIYYATDAPEFYTHAAGYLFQLAAPPGTSADHIAVTYLTNPNQSSGHFREPLPLSNGVLLAVHTADTGTDTGSGSMTNSSYEFRLKFLTSSGQYLVAGQPLTAGISENISFWDPDYMVNYNGVLWELNPVEVRPRSRPPLTGMPAIPAPEQQIFNQAGVDPFQLQLYLRQNNLALIISRDVTTRDDLDLQQPYNLRIPGGVQTIGASGRIYNISHLQLFQGDQLRGWTGGYSDEPKDGRRVLAQVLHDPTAINANPPSSGPDGSVVLGLDGSMAAFVPASRALTWQLTAPNGLGVVRERYWLTFQPGEIRVCTSCHGLSEYDQTGDTAPTNPPQALLDLLLYWQNNTTPPGTISTYLPLIQK